MTAKTLPPAQSFCSVDKPNLAVSALKKSDLDSGVLLRFYEIEGMPAEAAVTFLGEPRAFTQTNLLEEDVTQQTERVVRMEPYKIATIRLRVRQ
jgi:alpha-mannosidase